MLNTAKSKEMLIPRGGRWRTEAPPPLAMERVGFFRIIGVTIASDLSVLAHVNALLNAAACSICTLLRLLRAHGLPDQQALNIVARATRGVAAALRTLRSEGTPQGRDPEKFI